MVISRVTISNSTILNQLEAGPIMVSAMKSIAELSLPLRVYGPTRLTHSASHGVLITILDGRWPYFSVRLLLTWHDLHDFVMDRMVFAFLSNISQRLSSLQDRCALGAGDSGGTTSLLAVAKAWV